jgi:glycine oxidase
MTRFDTLVVGRGIAGAAVAWSLRWAGRSVAVADRGDPAAASRAAAGLVTPVTGQRFAVTDRFAECRPVAESFYRRAEAETGERFFHADGAVRLFRDAADRAAFARRADTHLRGLAESPAEPGPHIARHGAFGMPAAARLDAGRYLDASRRHFACLDADLDPLSDIELTPDGVRFPRLGIVAGAVVFCQGYAAAGNPWFPNLPINPVKGEVLTLRIPGLAERRAVHRGVWLAPAGDGLFRAGATYDRGVADATPTARGREEIVAGLTAFLRLPFEVVEHRAGVRPVVPGHRPVVAVGPRSDRVWAVNGLASKGVLYAPVSAAELVERMTAAGL